MTKFEEEVKRPKKAYIDPFSKRDVDFTGLAKKFTEGAQTLKEWKEYAFLLEDKLKLQQQALPVVPEDVAEWIEILKTKGLKPLKNPETYGETGFTEETLQNIVFWISEHQEDYMRAWLDGYTVEKPQLFYLRDELTGQFLAKDNQFKNEDRYFFWTGADPLAHSIGTAWKLTFTQQEIDSMQTGSYEKIEVHMEDGE
ncbi:hypothetical protein BU174_05020 [Lactococcus cremoris]|uniref:DUF1642 domain-containing protein n=4 Tax=Lactococcus lactis subsp. cremoris TaxID=1359 RepID=UPI000C7D10C0|nr:MULTISPECIES: DUF1642 domain-containing protein [Lactococcus]MCT0458684.1 DUF1642 domain-containing protein [Lactococcus cremoris]TEA99181.1 hypothetical protein BU174_05020 [Lactococcus cremoris]